MSEQIAFLRKKGGGLAKVTEKVLWTNPSPSANFAGQHCILSDNIQNYDYICITYKGNTADTNIYTSIMPVSTFIRTKYSGSLVPNMFIGNDNMAGTSIYARPINYANDTDVNIRDSYTLNQAVSSQAVNIPLQILGLNIATDDKYTEYEIVSLGQVTTATTNVTNIALNDNIDNYDYIIMGKSPLQNESYIAPDCNNASMVITETEYFKRNALTGYYTFGAATAMTQCTSVWTYAGNTIISVKNSDSRSRINYVYGIKATRKEKKPYTETVLWTNPSPTSNFAEQTVTLSQSVDNFKYIAVKYKAHTSSEDSTKFIISTDDLKKGINTTINHNICFVGSQMSGASYSRIIFYISSTSLSINTAYRTNRTENNNAYAIPLEILGLNELKYKPNDYMVVTGTVNVSLGSTVTVDLGFMPKKLTVWRVASSSLGTMGYYDEDISSSTYTRMWVNGSGSNANSARALPDTNTNGLCEITNNGFKVSATSTGIAGAYSYTAIGVK